MSLNPSNYKTLQRLRDKIRAGQSPRASTVPHEWVSEVPNVSGREVCLFVSYAPTRTLDPIAAFHANAWARSGFSTILIINADDPHAFDLNQDFSFATGVLLRANKGFDFGAWSTAVGELAGMRSAARAVFVNDGLYGPLNGFPEFLARLRQSPCDFTGAVESLEARHHYQSFLMAFGRRALADQAFWKFWRGIRLGEFYDMVDRYETRMLSYFGRRGFTTGVLIPADERAPTTNRTLTTWRELVDAGFPFIKRKLIRDNPLSADLSAWPEFAIERGYDPELVASGACAS